MLNVIERLKGGLKDRYYLDALSYRSRDDWVAALDALSFNCTVAALQRNNPVLTSVRLFQDSTADGVIAVCGALEGNSCVHNLELKCFDATGGLGASLSHMLMRNSSLVKVELSGEMLIES